MINELPSKHKTIKKQNCTFECCQNSSQIFVYEGGETLSCLVVSHGYNVSQIISSILVQNQQNSTTDKCGVTELSITTQTIQQFIFDVTANNTVILKAAFCVSCGAQTIRPTVIKLTEDVLPTRHMNSNRGMYGEPGTTIMAILLDISIFFIILHLIVFYQLPEVRNLPGKNLAAFCGTLLSYYTCCEISLIAHGCQLMALFCHLMLISIYSWMLVLSYDCWLSIRQATKNLQPISRKHTRRFLVYCFICWLAIPTIVVVTALYFQIAPEDTISFYMKSMPGKSGGCSRMEMKSFHVFSVVPASCLFLGNIVFYSHSTLIICRERQKKISTDTRNNLRVCLRLALMVNLWWILEFLGVLLEDLKIQFFYSIFTVSQGTFIFFIFTFQEKILRQLLILYKHNRCISAVLSIFVSNSPEEVVDSERSMRTKY